MSKKITQEKYESKILDKTNGEYEVVSEYNGMEHPIKILHHKCNQTYTLKNASCAYYHSVCCPYCRFSYVDEDYPELAKNFKDQTKTHIVKSSKEEVELICPCCGKIVKSDVAHYIRMGHVPCDVCNDGYTYPEKYIASILDQLEITYIHQFSPEWAGKYRYDYQFEYNNVAYILEVDGGIGHGYHDAYGQDKYDSLEKDITKEELAISNGYKILRIDCNYDNYVRSKYIRNNVEKVLSNIFDLNSIDWKECDLYASGSLFQSVIETYKNESVYVEDISGITGVKSRTIKKYLYDAMNSGLIPKDIIHNQDPIKRALSKSKEANQPRNGKAVYCFEDALVFKSVTIAEEYYGNGKKGLGAALRLYDGRYKGRHYAYVKDLPDDFDFKKFIFPDEEYDGHMMAQYSLDGELMKVYFRRADLPPGVNYTNIWRAATNKRQTAYGYKWKFISKKDEFEIYDLVPDKNVIARSYFYAQ